jgi:hypothetical protein
MRFLYPSKSSKAASHRTRASIVNEKAALDYPDFAQRVCRNALAPQVSLTRVFSTAKMRAIAADGERTLTPHSTLLMNTSAVGCESDFPNDELLENLYDLHNPTGRERPCNSVWVGCIAGTHGRRRYGVRYMPL